MSRILKDDREFCVKNNLCCDCFARGEKRVAVRNQQRERRQIPCCQEDFYRYVRRAAKANTFKYSRYVEKKRKAGLCSHPGCYNRLIPREILPSWASERACGLHAIPKPRRRNRIALGKLIVDRLPPEQRETVVLQNIVYKAKKSLAFVGLKHPNYYETIILFPDGPSTSLR